MLLTPASKRQLPSTTRDRWIGRGSGADQLEVVVPFTGVQQVQLGLRKAEQLCTGLNAASRVVRVVVVPFPLDLEHPAVPVAFIMHELEALSCSLPLALDVRLSRDVIPALIDAMPNHPLVVLATKRRPWRTREQQLARALKLAGYEVAISYEGDANA